MTPHLLHRRARRAAARLRARRWQILHPGVEVGRGARVGRWCRLFVDPGARLVLGDGCEIDDGCTVAVYGSGLIEVGDNAFFGHHCTLAARELIRVGAGTYLAEMVSIRDHDHAVGEPPAAGRSTVAPVVVGERVWLGAKVTVVRGASIGDGAVVGANAVVRGEVPAATTSVGVPARVVREHDGRD